MRSWHNKIPHKQNILTPSNLFWPYDEKRETKHLVTTGMMKGKRSMGKQSENMLDGLTKWLEVGRVTEALKATWDRDLWKIMIAFAKQHVT